MVKMFSGQVLIIFTVSAQHRTRVIAQLQLYKKQYHRMHGRKIKYKNVKYFTKTSAKPNHGSVRHLWTCSDNSSTLF